MTFCKMLSHVISEKVDKPSHSVLYLSTGTLSQHEVGILLNWLRPGSGKNLKILKKTCAERVRQREGEREGGEGGGCNVMHDFSFFKHPWPLEMKFLPCSEHNLGPLHLKILQP